MKKFNIVMVMIFSLFMLVACQQDDGVTNVNFQTDSHAEVTIYEDAALTQAVTTNSIDLEEGVTEIYFKVSYDTLYDADDISLGSSNNVTLTVISETNHVYKLSGINSDLTVTITSALESGSTTHTSMSATFLTDDQIELTLYATSELTSGSQTDVAYAKDSETGEIIADGTGDVFFSIELDDTYELSAISVTPSTNFESLEKISDGIYKISNLTGDVVVTILAQEIQETIEDDAYEGTFVLDEHVTVTIYETQTLENGTVTTTAIARDSDTGEILVNGDGQINFTVTLDEGYAIQSISITPTNYNNLKLPEDLGENTYRITKITSDLIITIETYEVNDSYNPLEVTEIEYTGQTVNIINNNGGISVTNQDVTIAVAGTYVISGTSDEGSLTVNIDEESDITLYLENLNLTSTVNAPIQILSANNATIIIEENSTVYLTDDRPTTLTETDETANAALYATCDLELSGAGELVVEGNYNNGIGSKDDLTLEGLTVLVTAINHGIKGSDSLTIISGSYDVTAITGDGLKTSNSDISDKGNQKGTITISGGTILINAAQDGMDAAYDVIIENDPTIEIYTTETYATGVGEGAATSEDTLYIRVSSTLYSPSYRYAILLTNQDQTQTVWVNATYIGSQSIDRRLYYFYSIELDSNYTSYTLYRFTTSQTNSTTTYNAKTETANLNTAYDMLSIGSTGISGTTIYTSWMMYQTTSTQGLSYSAKGIKADNQIYIYGGNITIKSYDDGIHTNQDALLETGFYGEGDVFIYGGTITITSKDDGIHGDQYVKIYGGSITILSSYEGVEGNVIEISGGITTIIATDDGINANGGSLASQVKITGGFVDITVGTGDTDAMDSNGSYVQTGGFVVSRSALTGGMGGALDVDGSVSITGGTFIGIGASEKVATSSGDNRSTGIFTITLSPATYTVKDASGNVIMTFTTSTYTYSRLWISSEDLGQGVTYSLYRDQTSIKTWTQT